MPEPPECPHRPPCPGCPRFGAPDLPPEAFAIARDIALAAKLPEPAVHQLPGFGARHRARLAVRGRSNSPKIGLFQAGSHRIADTPRCAIHHPLINDAARLLREAIRETGVAPYADRPHRGALRYFQCVVERATDRVQVILVGNGEDPSVLGDLPTVFAEKLGARLQGLFFNAQPERSNAILGPETLRLRGEEAVCERLGGADIFFPPAAFGQNHLPLFERAIDRIHGLVPDGARVAEFYCGVGAIGLGLLGRVRALHFNERSPAGLEGLARGLAGRPPAEAQRAQVFPGGAGERLDALGETDLVIVDPPRKGLDTPLRDALAASPPKRLIYLACGQEALTRDLEHLCADGRLRLSGLELFDFFPFTEHVETLAWLDATP